jgi:uncharacterized membrane protein
LTQGNAATHAFLYTNGVMTDLNSLLPVGSGLTITSAYGIDNNGDIVGTGLFNGEQYAVELIDPPSDGPSGPNQQNFQSSLATPEPLTALLMGGGLVAAGVLFRKKKNPNDVDRED